ncbi:MAG TPA: hypothetical protein VFX16_31025 [Pseudonocardiaceae bacterium]|nr:hypothetical protein [Pseudonocardiaceae bacterium]
MTTTDPPTTKTVGLRAACRWPHTTGCSYAQAYAAWAQRGYPANWSATNDGYPCQRSYRMQH